MQNSSETMFTKYTGSVFAMLAILLCVWGQFDKDEWTPDEPRVVAIAIEMAQSNDFIIPHLAGEPFVEKPPLYFALAASAIKILPQLSPVNAIRTLNTILAILSLYFTYLLGRDLLNKQGGLLALIVLGSMFGFISNTHWSRVDNLLTLSLVAGVWSFYYGLSKGRFAYLLLASIFAGISFLTKGLIGVVSLGICWFSFWVAYYFSLKNEQIRTSIERRFYLNNTLIWHALAVFLLVVICAGWIILFWLQGTDATWHEWFWVNNVGRFTGTAQELGHLHPGQPFYYIKASLEYSLPWSPFLIAWFCSAIYRMYKRQPLYFGELFLLFSIALNLIILTLSDTKRSLYLFPLLPLFAVVIVYAVLLVQRNWVKYYQGFWLGLCAILTLAILTSPIYASTFGKKLPSNVVQILSQFRPEHFIVLLCVVILLLWYRKTSKSKPMNLALACFVLFFTAFGILNKPINAYKSMVADSHEFLEKMVDANEVQIAGYMLNETTRSILYIYGSRKLSSLPDFKRAIEVLEGRDQKFNSLVIDQSEVVELLKIQLTEDHFQLKILAEEHPRSDKKHSAIYWLKAERN